VYCLSLQQGTHFSLEILIKNEENVLKVVKLWVLEVKYCGSGLLVRATLLCKTADAGP